MMTIVEHVTMLALVMKIVVIIHVMIPLQILTTVVQTVLFVTQVLGKNVLLEYVQQVAQMSVLLVSSNVV